MHVVVCTHCNARWSVPHPPTPSQLIHKPQCPKCVMPNTLLDIGYVPGVYPPPLYPESRSQKLKFPIVIEGSGTATAAAPVLMLMNFPESSDCAKVLGNRLAGELACKLIGEESELLFGLSRPPCEVLKTCTDPARKIAVIIRALLPLTPEVAGQVLTMLAAGRSLDGNGIHDLMCAVTPVSGPLNGRGLCTLMGYLLGRDGITPREFSETMTRLLTGPDAALTVAVLLGLGFLRTQLSKREVFELIRLLATGADGIGGASIVQLSLTLCTGVTTFRLGDFKDLVMMLCGGSGALSGKNLKELTMTMVGSNPSEAPRLKSALEKLQPLQPVEMLKIFNSLLAPVAGHLDPADTLRLLLALCRAESGLAPREVRELLFTLVMGGERRLTPTEFRALLRRASNGAEAINAAEVLALVRMLVKVSAEAMPRIDLLWLFDTLTGDTKLSPKQLRDILTELASANGYITPVVIRRMAGWFETTPLQFHVVVTEFHTLGFTPRQAEKLTRCCCTPLVGALDPDGLVKIVKVLRPLGTGIPVVGLISLFDTLCGGVPNPLTPVQFVEAMTPLCSGMAPTRILDLEREYLVPVNRIDPVQFHRLVRGYTAKPAGSITASEFADLALDMTMAPAGSLNATQAFTLLTKICPTVGLAPDRARLVLIWLRTVLTPTQVHTLIDTLLGFAVPVLPSRKTEALIVRLKDGDATKNNGLTPAEALQLVVSLLAGPLTVGQLEEITVTLTGTTSSGAQITISPRFLYRCSREALFAAHVSASLAGAGTPLSMQEVVHLLALGQDYGFLVTQMNRTFELFDLHFRNFATYATIRRFLKEARATGASWADVFRFLNNFVTAQRAPCGANTTLAPDGLGGAVVVTVARLIDGVNVSVRVKQQRINYFCNAHTYRHFDFARYDRAAQISFFPPGTTAAGMQLLVQGAINAGRFDALIARAMTRPNVFTRTETFGGDTETDDGGIYRDATDVFEIHHYHPAGDAISKELLLAFKRFFGL